MDHGGEARLRKRRDGTSSSPAGRRSPPVLAALASTSTPSSPSSSSPKERRSPTDASAGAWLGTGTPPFPDSLPRTASGARSAPSSLIYREAWTASSVRKTGASKSDGARHQHRWFELFVIVLFLVGLGVMHLVGDSKARTLSEYRRSMHDAVHGGGTLLDEDARVGEKNLLGEGHAGNEKLHASLLELERVQRTLRTGFVGMIHSTTLVVGGAALALAPKSLVVLGGASLVGCGIAAGLSEYLSQTIEHEFMQRETALERREAVEEADEEIDEMVTLYQGGLSADDARLVAGTLSKYPKFWVEHMLHYELHLKSGHTEPGLGVAFVTALAYIGFGVVPLLSLSGLLFDSSSPAGGEETSSMVRCVSLLKAAFYALSPIVAFFVIGQGVGASGGSDSALHPGLAHLSVGLVALAISFFSARVLAGASSLHINLFSLHSLKMQVGFLVALLCAAIVGGTWTGDHSVAGGRAGDDDGFLLGGQQSRYSFYLQVVIVSVLTCLCAGLGCVPFLFATRPSDRSLARCNLVAAGMMCAASVELLLEASVALCKRLSTSGFLWKFDHAGGSSSSGLAGGTTRTTVDYDAATSLSERLFVLVSDADTSVWQTMILTTGLGAGFMILCHRWFSTEEDEEAQFLIRISGADSTSSASSGEEVGGVGAVGSPPQTEVTPPHEKTISPRSRSKGSLPALSPRALSELVAKEERSFTLFLAMFLHAFAEGIALGVGLGSRISDSSPSSGTTIPPTGWSVALALGLHNIPEGMVVGLSLCSHGVAPTTALLLAVFSSAPQPLMAIAACAFVNFFTYLLPFGLCFAAGAMLCVSCTELWTEARNFLGFFPSAAVLGGSFCGMLMLNDVGSHGVGTIFSSSL